MNRRVIEHEYKTRMFGGKTVTVWAATLDDARHAVYVRTGGQVMRDTKATGRTRRANYQSERFAVGDRVKARVSGWLGTIIRHNKKNPSSPWVVRWDANGLERNCNAMVVTKEGVPQTAE